MSAKLKMFLLTNIIVWAAVLILFVYFVELTGVSHERTQDVMSYKLVIVNCCLLFSLMSAVFVYFDEIKVILSMLFSEKLSVIYSIIAAVIIIIYSLTGMLKFASGSAFIEKVANFLIILIVIQPFVFFIRDKIKNGGLYSGLCLVIFGFVSFFFFLLGGQKFPDIINKSVSGINAENLMLISFAFFLIIVAGWLEFNGNVKKNNN